MDKNSLRQLTKLCRINCTDEEIEKLLGNMDSILKYVELLNEVNTDNVKPCNQVCHFSKSVLADDEEGDRLDIKDFIKNAPEHIGGMVKTPTVIKY